LQRSSGAGGSFVLRFDDAEAAETRIAGAAAAAHLAASACAAGGGDVMVATADGAPLSAEAWDDINRACPLARPWIADGAPAPSISGRMLVRADALRRFLASDAGTFCLGNETIATNPIGSKGTLQAREGDAVAIADTGRAARWVLRGTAKAGDGIISRYLNRPVSQALSQLLLYIPGVRPWHLTVVTAIIGVAMMAALLWGNYAGLVVGGLLFHLASVVDGVDGEIARATYRSSARGATLDTAVDMATNLCFYLGFTIALTRLYGPAQAKLGGFSFVLASIGLAMMVWLSRRIGPPGNFDFIKRHYRAKCPNGVPRLIIDVFIALMSRDMFAFVWAIAFLLHGAVAIAYALAFFAALWVVLILIAAPTLLRRSIAIPMGSLALERSGS
jgi:CDP-L-myo-inositol myo-inositolphosphotransferase